MAKILDRVDHGVARRVHHHGMRSHLPTHLSHLVLFRYLRLGRAIVEDSWHAMKARVSVVGMEIILHAFLKTTAAHGLLLPIVVEAHFD